MEKKKIIILLILFVAVAGLTISTVSAATKTSGVYFKVENEYKDLSGQKALGGGDNLNVLYINRKDGQYSPNQMFIELTGKGKGGSPKYYKLVNATVKFSKKVNGKTYYSTKTFKPNSLSMDGKSKVIIYSPKNGYKPYYAKVTYKNK